jgi:hypothetical protein
MSPDIFRVQAKRYRRHLQDSWDEVSNACQLFRQEQDIWPAQCNRVSSSVLQLSDPLRNLIELMDTDRLPDEVLLFRSSIIVPLHYVDSLMNELLLLISAFRAVCRASSRDTMRRHWEIWRKCNQLAQGIDEILDNIDSMLLGAFSQGKATLKDTEFDPQPVA